MVGAPKRTKEAEASFHDVLADGGPTPESIMIARMRGAAIRSFVASFASNEAFIAPTTPIRAPSRRRSRGSMA